MKTHDNIRHEPDKTRIWLLLLLSITGLVVALVILGHGLMVDQTLSDARHLEAQGDFEGARRIYQERLSSHPDDAEAVKGLAVALSILHRFDEAVVYQEKAVRLDAMDSQLWVELGLNYLGHQGRPEEAVGALRAAADLDPSGRNRTLLAQALLADGRGEEAERELRSIIVDEPDFPFAYVLLLRELEKAGEAEAAAAVAESAAAHGVKLDAVDNEEGGA
jgi:tetratricopeptide (TPR) repeat protein